MWRVVWSLESGGTEIRARHARVICGISGFVETYATRLTHRVHHFSSSSTFWKGLGLSHCGQDTSEDQLDRPVTHDNQSGWIYSNKKSCPTLVYTHHLISVSRRWQSSRPRDHPCRIDDNNQRTSVRFKQATHWFLCSWCRHLWIQVHMYTCDYRAHWYTSRSRGRCDFHLHIHPDLEKSKKRPSAVTVALLAHNLSQETASKSHSGYSGGECLKNNFGQTGASHAISCESSLANAIKPVSSVRAYSIRVTVVRLAFTLVKYWTRNQVTVWTCEANVFFAKSQDFYISVSHQIFFEERLWNILTCTGYAITLISRFTSARETSRVVGTSGVYVASIQTDVSTLINVLNKTYKPCSENIKIFEG